MNSDKVMDVEFIVQVPGANEGKPVQRRITARNTHHSYFASLVRTTHELIKEEADESLVSRLSRELADGDKVMESRLLEAFTNAYRHVKLEHDMEIREEEYSVQEKTSESTETDG
jgi:hypothetical protein